MALTGIKNFIPIDDRLATAGQPTEAQLADVAAAGFGAVINLGLLDPGYCLRDEEGLAASLGLWYRQIPVSFDAPTMDNFSTFVEVMDGLADRRVFVHCAANYRVSVFMALWGQLRLGWTSQRADRLIDRLWRPSAVWAEFLLRAREELFAAPPFTVAATRFAAHLERAGWPRKVLWLRAADVQLGDAPVVFARDEGERDEDAAWDYDMARASGSGVTLTAVCVLGEATCAMIGAAQDGRLTTTVPATRVAGSARPAR